MELDLSTADLLALPPGLTGNAGRLFCIRPLLLRTGRRGISIIKCSICTGSPAGRRNGYTEAHRKPVYMISQWYDDRPMHRGSNYGDLISTSTRLPSGDYQRRSMRSSRMASHSPGHNSLDLYHSSGTELGDLVLAYPRCARDHLFRSFIQWTGCRQRRSSRPLLPDSATRSDGLDIYPGEKDGRADRATGPRSKFANRPGLCDCQQCWLSRWTSCVTIERH